MLLSQLRQRGLRLVVLKRLISHRPYLTYFLIFLNKSIKFQSVESPSLFPNSRVLGIRKMAVRVWLETATPPVFGKEMGG
jgi:hypothetical protein